MGRKPEKQDPGVRVEDLCHYFDGVERDRLDAQGHSRKSGELLLLRDRLLRLPDERFDAAMKAMKSLVDIGPEGGDEEPSEKRGRALRLYEGARPARGVSGLAGKVSPA